jgi:hypothetical protein
MEAEISERPMKTYAGVWTATWVRLCIAPSLLAAHSRGAW